MQDEKFIDKTSPNYRNKFYELHDLNKNKPDRKNVIKLHENKRFDNFPNENFDGEKQISTDKKYYNKKEQEENIFMKSSYQLMQHRIIKNFFSKRNFFNILGIPSQYAERNIYARNWKMCDSLMILSNFFIMIFAFFDYEINFSYPRTENPKNKFFRYLISLISLLAIVCVILRHYFKLKWKNPNFMSCNKINHYYSENIAEDEEEWFINDNIININLGNKLNQFFKIGLFIDILVNLLVPNPFFDFIITSIEIDGKASEYVKIDYLYSDIMFIFILVRTVYLVRATINYSIFTDNYAQSVSKDYGIKCNIRFALKCILKTHHIKVVILFFLASNLILGFVLRVFERPFWVFKGRLEFDYLSNSIWLIFITMLTIGFGEFVPLTFGGRCICMIAGLWGTFICSLVVVCLYGLFDLSNDQFLVFVKIVKGRSAIKFIQNAFLYRKIRFIRKLDKDTTKPDYDQMMAAFNEFKNMRNESKSIYRSNGLLFYNMRLLKEMKKVLFKFDKLEFDLDLLANYDTNESNLIKLPMEKENNQEDIEKKKIEFVKKFTNEIGKKEK